MSVTNVQSFTFDNGEAQYKLDISGKLDASLKGAADGLAELDQNGKVPSSQIDLSTKADKADTVLDTTLSRGRLDDSMVGSNSFAFGENVTASATDSHAEGYNTTASGSYSHAEGVSTLADGSISHAEGYSAQATGDNSHAEGRQTEASGMNSHAENYQTIASGENSHAEGQITRASGYYSHAEGKETTASSNASHAEGAQTTASGYASHAEGSYSTANGSQAHAEGQGTTASGTNSHAEGGGTTASGTLSHAEGGSTTASGDLAHSEGGGTLASGDNSHAEGKGGTFTWGGVTYTSAATGEADHTEGYQCRTEGTDHAGAHAEGYQTKASNTGSHAEGYSTIASGSKSHAEGGGAIASGTQAHAEGGGTTASGESSHAEGSGTQATALSAHAEGAGTQATSEYAHAEGFVTIAQGASSHAEGNYSKAAGAYAHAEGQGGSFSLSNVTYYSTAAGTADHVEGYQCLTTNGQPGNHAEGYQTQATGGASHSEGSQTLASGSHSHAEGYSTKATGTQTHAEGYSTLASGHQSHAEGCSTTASGDISHAEGNTTTASGNISHAEGGGTTASGSYSHSEGLGTIASGFASHVSGAYNIADSYDNWPTWTASTSYKVGDKVKRTVNDIVHGYICKTANSDSSFTSSKWVDQGNKMNYAEIIGNGTDDSHRANIRTLDWDGNEVLGGGLKGLGSIAMGGGVNATGNFSAAIGAGTTASGDYSQAFGTSTVASGNQSHAEGSSSTATSFAAHAEGFSSTASGSTSHAEGNQTTASGYVAHAEGNYTTATGSYSHAEGNRTTANADASHAEGLGGTYARNGVTYTSQASNFAGHIEGYQCIVEGSQPGSHAEGYQTRAIGNASHSEGANTLASGQNSHAEGYETIAAGGYSHVSGRYNIPDNWENWTEWVANTSYEVGDEVKRTITVDNVTTVTGYTCKTANSDAEFTSSNWWIASDMNYLEIVGNGAADNARSNARALDRIGNEYLAGDLYVHAASNSTGGTKVATISDLPDISGKINLTEKGVANGVAELDQNGKVPSSQLPSYVDDVLEYSNLSSFPVTGEAGKIYIALDTNKTYRWSGSDYAEISASLALGTTSSTAFRGDYGDAAYSHAVTNKGSAFSNGLYKITTNSEGHVTAATVVTKSDITTLGIPGSDTDTHRPIQVAGVQVLGDNTTALNFAEGSNVTITESNGTITIAADDTAYESKTAASGGIDESLVTTGEKYIWNNKIDSSEKGAANGVAELDANGKVPNSQLDLSTKADKAGTVLDTTLSRGRKENTTIGAASFAFGDNVTASGANSHAEGYQTIANGTNSHVEGYQSTASGNHSHAEGYRTVASQSSAHAEGDQTTAGGSYAHAEGSSTTASGGSSHAEGYETTASEAYAHAEGYYATASGVESHAEGSYTVASGTASHAEGSGGTYTVDGTTYHYAAVGEADHVEGYHCRTEGSSKARHAEGYETVAKSQGSHAEGSNTTASNTSAHAEGSGTTASGSASHAEGSGSTASGSYSHAEGGSRTTAQYAHAEGYNTTASADQAHAEGSGTTASGANSHAEGYSSHAIGVDSHAEGYSTTASGYVSHAEGYGRDGYSAIGQADHVEGYQCWTDGSSSYGKHAEGYQTHASGEGAHSEGKTTEASGLYSHAEGTLSQATSDAAHAEGYNTRANGAYSHAEGSGGTFSLNGYSYTSAASGRYSHSEGYVTLASGVQSHAEGYSTLASSASSHAEGSYATASGACSHAEGASTKAQGDQSHAEGATTVASNYQAHAEGASTTASGQQSHAEGAGTTASGQQSHAEGVGTTASAQAAHAEGSNTTASGVQSHAEGNTTYATNAMAHAEGYYSKAEGAYAHAEGYGGTYTSNGITYTSSAVSAADHVEGYQCLTANSQPGNHAEGYQTQATGGAAHSEGNLTVASGAQSHAEGSSSKATGGDSHAEGYSTTASGINAHTEGKETTASGWTSHAEGEGSVASGSKAHAEGTLTTASGHQSHAEGCSTVASGNNSHAEGGNTIANGEFSHVVGFSNIADSYDNWDEWIADTSYEIGDKVKRTTTSNNVTYVNGYICKITNSDSTFTSANWTAVNGQMNFAEIVGNGTCDIRSNARALDWDGNEYLAGDIYIHAASNSTGGTKVATVSDIPDVSGKINTSEKGAANGVAELDANGKVPSFQLPSYVDDVLEYSSVSAFPATGETGIIYVDTTANTTYRWSGSSYVAIGGSLTLGETSSTAYRGDYGAAAYAHGVTNKGSAFSNGLYKITTNSEGHVTAATAVVKADITGLGIPESDTTYSVMTGASSSAAGASGLVPAPAIGDESKFLSGDGTWASGGRPMVILSYGTSVWSDFENAYKNNVIVYCRASSNSNPATGSQTRMAFMAYVNDASTPTNVEFQYYRSVNSHSSSQMGDQVFVYKLDKTSGWSVTTREASIKQIKAGTGTALDVSWSSNVVTLTNTMTANDMPMSSSDATTAKAAIEGKADLVSGATSGNFASLDSNGNLVDSGNKASDFLTSHQDITGKADKVTSATNGNFAALDSNGNLTDSGHSHSDYLTSHQDITGKADKVSGATNGNFAALDSNGNLTDSGSKASDFITDISGKTDKVSNAISGNFAALDSNGNLTDSGHKHSDYLTSHQDISGKLDASEKGVANGVAELDQNGKVPSSQLPSYVDDVVEYSSSSNLPATGETGKIYVTTDNNKTYRWSGSEYVEISASLALGTTSSTAYRGDYGAAAYTHGVTNKGSAFSSGLYKITTNSEGHVTAATAVQKSDITGLGIPGSDTNTHRPIQVNGTQALGDNTTALNLKNGTNVTITNSNGEVTIAATDTTYESKQATSGGTDLSLVTTGEKYTWNSKTSNTGTVTKVSTGAGLTGGDVTTTGTIKANLTSETKLSNAAADGTETSGRVYPVRLDTNGKLAVNVPWANDDTKNTAGTTNKTGTKMYLAAATSQGANPQTYSNSNCYIGTDNCLYSGGIKVLTAHQDISGKVSKSGDTMSGKLTLQKGTNQLITGTGTAGQAGSASAAYVPSLWTFNLGLTPIDGDILTIKIPVAGVNAGVWMSVDNGTTYYPVALTNKARLSTQYVVNETLDLIFQTGRTTTTYGTDTTGASAGASAADLTISRWAVLNYYDSNTTYSTMSTAETAAGTASSNRVIQARYLSAGLKQAIVAGTSPGQLSVYGTNVNVITNANIVDVVYPVGSIYMSVNNSNPSTLFSGTTWEQIEDKFLLGASSVNAASPTYSGGDTGGNSTHTLTTDEIPSHSHGLNSHTHAYSKSSSPTGQSTGNTGGTSISTAQMPNHSHSFSVNNIYMSSSDSSSTHIGWTSSNRVNYACYEKTIGGNGSGNSHSHSLNSHTHTVGTTSADTGGASGNTESTGGGNAFSIMPPYLAVYIWKRVS